MAFPVVSLSANRVVSGCMNVLQGKKYLKVNDQAEAKLAHVGMGPKVNIPSESLFQEQHFDTKIKLRGGMTRKLLTFFQTWSDP